MKTGQKLDPATGLTRDDFQWFMHSPFFEAIPDEAKKHLFRLIRPRKVNAGERFIRQGDDGRSFYIIREGVGTVNLERDGEIYSVGRVEPGDIVGEMAVLTGEKRNAHVDAETDCVLWRISRNAFDDTCIKHPEVRDFLTNVLYTRFTRALVRKDLVIGKYFVDRALGKGGFSIVYHGVHSILGMPVAVKMLRHNRAMDPVFVEEFRNEAKAIAQLNHENIVKVYDVEELYRTFFIIMEYVEGRSLDYVLLREQRRPLEELFDFLLQTCFGLMHAHENGVIHRDIKPGNILVSQDKKVKLVDFGLSCARGAREDVAKGSPLYVSPEQITGDPVDERADIYSLGITAYELFTGQPARKGDTVSEILSQHLEEPVTEPRATVPDLPRELNDFIMRCTRRDPDLRDRTVGDILYDLEPLARRLGIKTRRDEPDDLNMMSLYLFYRGEQRETMKKLVKEFSRELEKVGARLRGSNFENIASKGPRPSRRRPRDDSAD